MNSFDTAIASLTSIPVLAFALGIVASKLKADLTISRSAVDIISFVLLLAIGLKGGFALQKSGIAGTALPISLTLLLGCVIPLIAFALLRFVRKLTLADRGALAAHYGSTSLVTFTAAIVFLENSKIEYEGYVTTLLVAMEIPGILIGILLAKGGLSALRDRELLREVFFGKTVLLLLGGVIMGYIAGPKGYESVKTLFVDAQPGLLTLFLLTLGIKAGQNFKYFRELGFALVAFAVLMPLIGGTLGAIVGAAIGLSAGGATALAVLCASASYIAAPAAVAIALPQANQSIPITASLGITFPFNLIFGLPIYFWLADFFTRMF
ncbi:MAG: sodium-dependent bicarbonate transport family permease [Micrococcales bacterium]